MAFDLLKAVAMNEDNQVDVTKLIYWTTRQSENGPVKNECLRIGEDDGKEIYPYDCTSDVTQYFCFRTGDLNVILNCS